MDPFLTQVRPVFTLALKQEKYRDQMRNRLGAAVALLVCFSSIPLLAQEGLVYEYEVRGVISPSNLHTVMTLKMTQGHANAVLVFSEPSHTLLAAFLDNHHGEPTEQTWFPGLLPPGTSQMHMNMSAGVKGTITRGRRPADSDTYLTIDTLVDHDGAVRTNTFRANLNPQSFSFGLGWERPHEHEADGIQAESGHLTGGS